MKTKLVLLFSSIMIFDQVFGQDTVVYEQANASMFSNSYTFIRKNKTDKYGDFFQISFADVGESFIGVGTFKESKRKIHLVFDTTELEPKINYLLNENDENVLTVKWYNWVGIPMNYFSVKYTDTTINKDIYHSNWNTGILQIPFADLKDSMLTLYKVAGRTKILDFKVPNGINQIEIFAYDILRLQRLKKTNEVLKKRKKGFKTVGMWSYRKKKTLFVRSD